MEKKLPGVQIFYNFINRRWWQNKNDNMTINSNFKTRLIAGGAITWTIISAALLFAAFAIWSAFMSVSSFDEKIFNTIAPHITDGRTRLMLFITFGGNSFFLIGANVLLLAFFIIKKNKWWAICVATISLTSVGLMSLIKNLVHRHRPPEPMVEGVTNFSFPSGHAFMCVAFYGLIAYWVAINIKNTWLRRIIIALLLLLILIIGFSRVYLRMHYPTDVIAGFSLSTVLLILCLVVIDNLQAKEMAKRK
jgi:undecaprenyl-diphosphatase